MEGNFLLIDFHTYSLDERSMETWHMAPEVETDGERENEYSDKLEAFFLYFLCLISQKVVRSRLLTTLRRLSWQQIASQTKFLVLYMFVCENNKTKSNENDVFAQLSGELERG